MNRSIASCAALIAFNALADVPVSGADVGWSERRGAAEAPAVRVMTYNIRCEGGDRKSPDNNWGARRDDLVDLVRRENPDVAGFQEVEPDQLKWLAGRFADYTFVGVGRNADGRGEASPVAFRTSRFDAVTNGTFWLSEKPDVPGSRGWDAAAFGLVGILLTFLGGLMAVDLVPKCAAGAALGIAGMGNYVGAGMQSIISGYLVYRAEDGTATLLGHTFANGYTIDFLAVFWIGVAALSVVLTLAAGCRQTRRG